MGKVEAISFRTVGADKSHPNPGNLCCRGFCLSIDKQTLSTLCSRHDVNRVGYMTTPPWEEKKKRLVNRKTTRRRLDAPQGEPTPWGDPTSPNLWTARTSYGSRAKVGVLRFSTPLELWLACVEYFEWVEANPLIEGKVVSYKGDTEIVSLPKMRAMTQFGMCVFLGIGPENWRNYCEREGYVEVCRTVEAVIREQKFTGAAADLLNANLIARDLGLAEKTITDVTVSDERSPEEVAAGIESKLAGIAERKNKS